MFGFRVLDRFEDEDSRTLLEQKYILKYGIDRLYNAVNAIAGPHPISETELNERRKRKRTKLFEMNSKFIQSLSRLQK